MSLVFAGITPHSPLLIPDIGKEQIEKLQDTVTALNSMEQDLYIAKPDILFILSAHGSFFEDAFTVNGGASIQSNFEKFGDLSTRREWTSAPNFAAQISHEARIHDIPVRVVNQTQVDHGVSVPLFYLTNHMPNTKILTIGYSDLDAKTHLNFGALLKEVIMSSDRRVAVIASGDLSYVTEDKHNQDAAKIFDTSLIDVLQTHNTVGITKLDHDVCNESGECIYLSALILMGILQNMNYTFKQYAYEKHFGISYLTAQCTI